MLTGSSLDFAFQVPDFYLIQPEPYFYLVQTYPPFRDERGEASPL